MGNELQLIDAMDFHCSGMETSSMGHGRVAVGISFFFSFFSFFSFWLDFFLPRVLFHEVSSFREFLSRGLILDSFSLSLSLSLFFSFFFN